MITQNRILIFALMAMVILAASASAATMSASPTAPEVNNLDIANYIDTGNLDKWFCIPGEWASMVVGQTFMTGDPATLNAITYQIADTQQAPPTKTYTIRVCTVDRVDPGDTSTWVLTEIYSETCIQDDFTVNSSEYMTWTLDTPVSLAAGVEYGIDVGMNSSTTGWQEGISYIKYSTADQYADGTRYWSGWFPDQGDIIPGVGNETMVNVSGDRVFHIDMGSGDPSLPDVDAGIDMITWSGREVQLDPTVVNNDPNEPQGTLSYLWTADPVDGVVFSPSAIVEAPTVTITKATANPSPVTMTLAVTLEGKGPVEDSMTIDVYDDNCLAAKATDTVELDPTDFDDNCITNLADFAKVAADWLVDYAITEPVEKP